MKQPYLVSVLLALSTGAVAQVPTLGDSLIGYMNSHTIKKAGYADNRADSIYFYQAAINNAAYAISSLTQFAADTGTRHGHLQLQGLMAQRAFRLPAEAYKEYAASLYTTGVAAVAKWKLYGSFTFYKKWQDSLANNLTPDVSANSPYFYYTPKAGTYQRQAYNIAAGALHPLFKKLYAGAAVLYDYFWGAGAVDPRAQTQLFAIKLQPEVVWHAKKNIYVGVNVLFGKGDESYDIVYKNSMYNYSTLYPERNFYLNYGYGTEAVKSKELDRSAARFSGAGVSFHYKKNSGSIAANFNYLQDYTSHYKPKASGNKPLLLANYLLKTYSGTVLYNAEKTAAIAQVKLWADYANGSDHNYTINAINYFYKQTIIGGTGRVLLKTYHRFMPEFAAGATYEAYSKEDLMQNHLLRSAKVLGTLTAGGNWNMPKSRLAVFVQPGIACPISNTLLVPKTQENSFTKNIARPEYYYNGYKIFSAGLLAKYSKKNMFKNTSAGLFAKLLYEKQIGNTISTPNIIAYGNSRVRVEAGFDVFL